ncbi:MAG TPA: hypothetical protein VFN88_02195 [Caulobacteraceae bacterium]|nr:hypothetical protein [Caulobacteraceae bacterium]
MVRRPRRRLAWVGALTVSAAVHGLMLSFLVQDRGGPMPRVDRSAVNLDLARPPQDEEKPRPTRRRGGRAPRADVTAPTLQFHEPSAPQAPIMEPFAQSEAPARGAPGAPAQPGLSFGSDPCALARRAALTPWQREQCDRRGRDYMDFAAGKRAPQFEQQAKEGYAKPDLPYLPRKPEHGCKPYAAPIPSTGTSDQVMAGVACVWKF